MPGPASESQLEALPGKWRFRRADPLPELRDSIKEFWEVEGELEPFRESILPHGMLELMINIGPPHRIIGGHSEGMWRSGWLSGLQEESIRIESLRGTHLVSARLYPIGAVELLGVGVAAFANTVVDLRKFLGRTQGNELLEAVKGAEDPQGRFAALESFLQSRERTEIPDFVRSAARRIEETHGNVRINDLEEELGVSRKHLAVTFRKFVGVTPRSYAKVQRFAWTVTQLQSAKAIDWSKLSLEAGYSDQSHLIRDFRRIGGNAAIAFVSRLTPDGIALWES